VSVAGYDVFQASAAGDERIGRTTVTGFVVPRLAAETSYAFYVKARDGAGNLSPASATVSATTLSAGAARDRGMGCSSTSSAGLAAALLLVVHLALRRGNRADGLARAWSSGAERRREDERGGARGRGAGGSA
jgi:hypothetical protein